VSAAASRGGRVLAHPLLQSARVADAAGKCRREVPVTLALGDGRLLEGVVDLAFEQDGTWMVVDFKTDDDPSSGLEAYRTQVALYAASLARAASSSVHASLMVV